MHDRHAQFAQLVDLLYAGLSVRPSAVTDHILESRPAGVCELEVLGAQADRVAAERGAAAGADPRDQP